MQAHVDANAHSRKLTKTLYEADDTCPAPFCWDLHNPEQQQKKRSGTEVSNS